MIALTLIPLNIKTAGAECTAVRVGREPVKKVVLHGIAFDADKTRVQPEAVPLLDEAARLLGTDDGILVVAEPQDAGADSQNLQCALDSRGAATIRAYLVDHGVAASRIAVEPFGQPAAMAGNTTTMYIQARGSQVELHR
jgi:outer membrane protein OmpA-like peptidoglycan-associated protein